MADVSRRVILRLFGASAAVAGAEACSRGPQEYIVPYVNQPPEVTPSVATVYATTMTVGGYGVGILATSHEGRPTKLEGNPEHPASLGALGTIEQASLWGLYDPKRAQGIRHGDDPATWSAIADLLARPAQGGKKTFVLLEPTSSPHLVDLVRRVRARGDVFVGFHSPLERRSAWEGARLAFGRVLEPRWDFSRADVVLSLDADFLAATGSPQAWARAWASRRRIESPNGTMSRLYVVEPRVSVTGSNADERLAVQSRQVASVAADVLSQISPRGAPRKESAWPQWVHAVARDLWAHVGTSLVVAGDAQPAVVHAMAHALNEVLGNVGRTVTYAPSPIFEAGEGSHGIEALAAAMDAGDIGLLVVAGGNPVYTAPADVDLEKRIRALPASVYVGSHENETARACSYFVPEAHYLESWGDALAFDGTASIAQPIARPLVADGRTPAQVLAAMLGRRDATSRDLVEEHWQVAPPSKDFASFWRRALVQGVVPGEGTATVDARVSWAPVTRALGAPTVPPAPFEIVYFADAKVHDGGFSENEWLQELPDPVTRISWDNAALVSAPTARSIPASTGDVVHLEVGDRSVRAPLFVLDGMAEGVVALALGYGHEIPDRVSTGVGANAYALRRAKAPWADDMRPGAVSGTWELARVQEHESMEGRPIALHKRLDEYRKDPGFARELNETPPTLYDLQPSGGRQWGMAIDLNACTGCSACVVACIAENNVPVVGKTGVALGRVMHWLRIDRYAVGDIRGGATVAQPMLCQHCEKAPCEYVCPVNATVHSSDGLNEMIYNRCVGTRFCSNNCPYKVRRFNFFQYNRDKPESLRLAMNPDVTVRDRGVMEKCTYCVQRIRQTEIRARREQRPIRDGEIQTACQQTCPTGAIVFGDIADGGTRVSAQMANGRVYQVLQDLGTMPRTRYLARIVNPNPELDT